MQKFEKTVKLNFDGSQIVKNQLNFSGVNYELHPIVHMTSPTKWKSKSLIEAPVNEKLFSSVILLFGFIPIDVHHLCFKQIFENGFKETSSSVLMKHWNHYRRIEKFDQGCVLTDEISFSTRLPFLEVLIKPIYLFVFGHRHERLKRKFGEIC